ncbi:Aprataxin [Operophtera brumata]|uniref:Aprataxin n=1 Tax=Operophtera brumata TaxID=104452 RepID=A0A0L7L1C0_OPEBR|nr:Aprataxin [Operophtera brumata]
MNKRLLPAVQQSINPKKPKHWSLSLLDSMKDPDSIVKSTEKLVVIRDKYPKAKVHYLILPHEEISSIYKLNHSHVKLIEDFGQMYKKIQEDEDYSLKAGFHAIPSMQRLHMHIISTDMISPCLKTKIHWNSFTTEFFLPYDDVLRELKENGSIQKMTSESHKKLMSTELQCNQCSYKPKNMPQLKEHLRSHSI